MPRQDDVHTVVRDNTIRVVVRSLLEFSGAESPAFPMVPSTTYPCLAIISAQWGEQLSTKSIEGSQGIDKRTRMHGAPIFETSFLRGKEKPQCHKSQFTEAICPYGLPNSVEPLVAVSPSLRQVPDFLTILMLRVSGGEALEAFALSS